MIMITIDTIQELLKNTNRNLWIDKLKPLITNEDNNHIYINDIQLPFTINELETRKFNIEPGFYTHKKYKGIVYISDYLSLDDRFNSRNKEYYILEYGSKVDFYGVNDKGYTFGYESGFYSMHNISDTHYFNFDKISYKPKEGELLYYLEKLYNNEITAKSEIYEDSIFCYTSGGYYKNIRRKFIIGDTSHRRSLEKFFIDYD